jgi:hypothetical protein
MKNIHVLPKEEPEQELGILEVPMPIYKHLEFINDNIDEFDENIKEFKHEGKVLTTEDVRKVERSDLYNKIHSIVKQIPREDVETDAMDASSCAYDIEQLFYKWQQERSYSDKDLFKILLDFVAFPHDHMEPRGSIIERYLKELKNK